MIGKGAQYLTAAGFGRYRITAASLGSLDLLGTLGGWLTAATKQAIMDAFGVDGTAVIVATNEYLNGIAASDKAKATALAGFINQYPMIVGGLVDTGNKRVVMNSTGESLFITDIVPNQASDELYNTFKLLTADLAGSWGHEDTWSSNMNAFVCGPASGNGTFWYHNAGGYRNQGPLRSSKVGQWLTQFITKSRCGLLGIDEASLGSGAAGTWQAGKYVQLSIAQNYSHFEALMKRDGSNLCRLIPAADNVMFDAERLIAIQNTGTGTSKVEVISYTPTP